MILRIPRHFRPARVRPRRLGGRVAPVTGVCLHARGAALESGAAPSVQLFPPGEHQVVVTDAATGKPVPLVMVIDAATAETLEAARAAYQAAADAGQGDAPYLDFNHADGPAAAWVKRVFWAGDDPKSGGVRAMVEWTDAGREAIEGKLYRRFSPSFTIATAGDPPAVQLDAAGRASIIGAPVNMGGLVNRAAFRTIACLLAAAPAGISDPPDPPDPPDPTEPNQATADNPMTPEEAAAMQAENESLRARVAELEAALAEAAGNMQAARRREAESAVECAAKEGRIPAAAEVKAKWIDALVADPAAGELLAGLVTPAALKPVIATSQAAPPEEGRKPVSAREHFAAQLARLNQKN
jgi:hypothetical protein